MGGFVFLSCQLFGIGYTALELAGRWVELGFSIETEISGRALADWYYMGPGCLWWSNVLNSALPPQRLRPDTRPEHQDPVSHTAMSVLNVKPAQQLPGSQSPIIKCQEISFHMVVKRPRLFSILCSTISPSPLLNGLQVEKRHTAQGPHFYRALYPLF